MISLIVGLGNPGIEYARTYHNLGFWLVDILARATGATFLSESKFLGETTRIQQSQPPIDCRLLKPQTYMNRSGQSVQLIMQFYKIKPEQVLVVHDDIDLPLGELRLKKAGGHGGHNGLRDIIQHVGEHFYRLRIGVGHPGHKDQVTGYVLSPVTKKNEEILIQSISEALEVLPLLFSGGFTQVQQHLHSKNDE